jgi:uncharacterized protein (DUF488 family)
MQTIYTIGHSTHTIERFLQLLGMHDITAVCDVRSSPYSRFNPQFNKENLQRELKLHQLAYVHLGNELGPRSSDPACYENRRVRYDRIARTQLFRDGLKRLKEGLKTYRIAMMCAEKDPLACHRTILICRYLRSPDFSIRHILEDGGIEENSETERRLLRLLKIPELQLFETREALIEQAYRLQSEKIAYSAAPDGEESWKE